MTVVIYVVESTRKIGSAHAPFYYFFLNGKAVTVNNAAPDLPLIDYIRSPEIGLIGPKIVIPNVGVTYTSGSKKQEEHGGLAHDDTNVMLLVSNPSFRARTVTAEVQTAQVAPTVLQALGLNPNRLYVPK